MEKVELEKLYLEDKLSMMEIATSLGCSAHKVDYWMNKHRIKRRTISEAIYQKNNPNGDPFEIKSIRTKEQAELFGLGIGLYWGEGNKANQYSVRLGNTDPELLKTFMRFMIELFSVKKEDFHFTLQIFSDINVEQALSYWIKELGVKREQFYRPTITISGSIGTYKHKSEHGVVTINYHNKKLRDIIVAMLPR
jgi:hypothetical protein